MQTFSQSIGAGGFVEMQIAGTFFRLLASSAPVDVQFYRRGAVVAEATGMEAGYAEEFAEAFDEIRITSATAQAPKWAIRHGGSMRYDRIAGEVGLLGGDLTNTQKTVTNADGQMLAGNAARRYLLIQNKDALGNIYVKFGAGAATTANGIRIAPGDSLELATFAARNEVRAIGDIASNANVLTVEG